MQKKSYPTPTGPSVKSTGLAVLASNIAEFRIHTAAIVTIIH